MASTYVCQCQVSWYPLTTSPVCSDSDNITSIGTTKKIASHMPAGNASAYGVSALRSLRIVSRRDDRLEDGLVGLLLLRVLEHDVRAELAEDGLGGEHQRAVGDGLERLLVLALRLRRVVADHLSCRRHRRDVVDVLGEAAGDLRLVEEVHQPDRVDGVLRGLRDHHVVGPDRAALL